MYSLFLVLINIVIKLLDSPSKYHSIRSFNSDKSQKLQVILFLIGDEELNESKMEWNSSKTFEVIVIFTVFFYCTHLHWIH